MRIGSVGCCALILEELHSLLFIRVSALAMNVLNCTGTAKELLWGGPGELEAEEGGFHSVLCLSNTLIGGNRLLSTRCFDEEQVRSQGWQ